MYLYYAKMFFGVSDENALNQINKPPQYILLAVLLLGREMNLTIQADFSQATAQLDDFQKRQMPFATKNTLNRLATKIIDAEQDEMQTVFDKPKRWTLNSLTVRQYATKQQLSAIVGFKESTAHNRSASRYLTAQIQGGRRRTKAVEHYFVRHGLMPSGYRIIPVDVRLDSYGNITLAMFRKIVSGVQAGTHFVLLKPHGRLPAGLYQRKRGHKGKPNQVTMLIMYVPDAQYQKRMRYFERATQAMRDHHEAIFTEELNKALASSR